MTERPQKPPYPLRMPDQLRTDLESAAKSAGRSLNAEIVDRLDKSFRLDEITTEIDDLVDGRTQAYKRIQKSYIAATRVRMSVLRRALHLIEEAVNEMGRQNFPAIHAKYFQESAESLAGTIKILQEEGDQEAAREV